MKAKIVLLSCLVAAGFCLDGQARSPKRGICWDEKTQPLTDAPVEKMLPGVSWLYTWGEKPVGEPARLGTGDGIAFVPMAWGRNFDGQALRQYIGAHKSVKYLLGFNEPNFAAQSALTPAEAAALWPRLEKIASDYGLKLVAPALNFTGESVGGRVWGVYDWLDEFIRVYKEKNRRLPVMDCLALHCYMNWYSATMWFVNDYFYSDIFKDGNDTRYPNIVEMLRAAQQATGHYPRMMLTEFCSWEGDKDGFTTNVENQIDQMTQRVQKLEQSPLVEGYAWFMANSDAAQYPYMSVFQNNIPDSPLGMLGTVYVHMSAFDRDKYYTPGETIQAKDYVDATTDGNIVRLRPNREWGSDLPLTVQLSPYSAATYQIDVPSSGTYTFTLHARTTSARLGVRAAGATRDTEVELTGHPAQWTDYTFTLYLQPGKSTIRFSNLSAETIQFNSWSYGRPGSVDDITASAADTPCAVYTLQGIRLGCSAPSSPLSLDRGLYLLVYPDGTSRKLRL